MHAAAIALLLLAGCDGGTVIVEQAKLDSGGGATGVSFAALGGVETDVVLASPKRGEVDVITRDANGWSLFGSFFAGGAVEAVGAIVGKKPALLVRDEQGSVALLGSEMPHRLEFPVQIYRRVRNGQPVDDTPPAVSIAAADVDGDGDDELIVASALGVVVVRGLAALLTANPEHPPPANGWRLAAGPQPSLVAAADLDGDGRPDLLAIDAREAAVYRYDNQGGGNFGRARIELSTVGRGVVGTRCGPMVVLADGKVVRIGATAVPALQEVVPVEQMAAGRDLLAVTSKQSKAVALFDACGQSGAPFGPDADQLLALAVGSSSTRVPLFATLAKDGHALQIYGVGE